MKQKGSKFLTLILFVLLFQTRSVGQEDIATQIAKRLTTYSQQHFQEKIFVHTDKSFYVAGEIIWFKLYNTDAYLNQLSAISKVAYVELISGDHQPLLQAKVELQDGKGNGSFMLPFSIASGTYSFRAYTNWMKNFSADLFFEKPLHIINTLKKAAITQPPVEKFAIRFFPESGNLVNGLRSKVAFHAVDAYGKGVSSTGMIVNQRGDTIASFATTKMGMGHFYMVPHAGDQYRAIVQSGEMKTEIDLPAAYDHGYTMEVTTGDDSIAVSVQTREHANEPVYLLAHTRQVVKYAAGKMLSGDKTQFKIPRNETGDGVSHFTLFNSKQQPVCERLYFRPPAVQLDLRLTSAAENYSLRKKVSVNVASTIGEETVDADMSIAVYRVDSLQDIDEEDIQTYLWLSSELKGRVESPAYYFNRTDPAAAAATDNLMLTQGWSRFKWEDITENVKPAFRYLPEYEGMLISASMKSAKTGLPAAGKAYLSIPGQRYIFRSANSGVNGQLLFNTDKFYGNADMILQGLDKAGEAVALSATSPFATSFSSRKYLPLPVQPAWQTQLTGYSIGTQVENSFVREKKLVFYLPQSSDTTAFFGSPDKAYMLDDYTRFITMEEVMREYITDVRVRKTGNSFHFRVKNKPVNDFFDRDPLVLLDGLPVVDINKLMEFDPLKIKRVDVLTRKYFSGSEVIDGIVSYTTYKGNLDGFTLDPGAVVVDYPGLQLQREFYSPVYENDEQFTSPLPDFRNLLYWSPDIKTSKGIHSFDFYTSDRPGRYAVIAQAIHPKGAAGSSLLFFTVHK